MLTMMKRYEIEVLLKAGHPKTEVARLAGVSARTVHRVAEESPVVHVDDALEREKRRIGRPSQVENFRKLVFEILKENADLPSREILRRAREAGYQAGKTALYGLVASVRPKSAKPMVRFEGLPGEFSQHDFGEYGVEFVDGSARRVHFFVESTTP
jgi:IS30 family transposase